jgi:hypothetical protein
MKKTNLAFPIVLSFAFLLLCSSAYGRDDWRTRGTLVGFESVRILVEGLDKDVKEMGLTESQLYSDIERKLRNEGIRVLGAMEVEQGKPILYLEINSVPASSKGGSIFNIDLSFWQDVQLGRSGEYTRAPTWSSSVVGATYEINRIRNYVKDLVDIFINAWLSVNPMK